MLQAQSVKCVASRRSEHYQTHSTPGICQLRDTQITSGVRHRAGQQLVRFCWWQESWDVQGQPAGRSQRVSCACMQVA